MEDFVSVNWLADHLEDVVVIDVLCGVSEPDTRSVGIPGARVVNLDAEGSDHTSGLPHTMLSPGAFERVLGDLGLHPGDQIVCYDGQGIFSAPRLWWMLRSAGIDAKVLDGGLPAWQGAGFEVRAHEPNPGAGTIKVAKELTGFIDMDGVLQALTTPGVSVVDARAAGRFNGTTAEPRPGLACGHMPGAINLPFTDLLIDGHIRPDAPDYFKRICGDPHPLITSCGSGVSACVLALVATQAGYTDVRVYDGAWAEWGQPHLDNPIAP